MSPGRLLLWLSAAVLAQVLVALFGVIARSLQTRPDPPIPALRLLFIISALALAFLSVVDALSRLAGAAARRRPRLRQQRRQQHESQPGGKPQRGSAPADIEAQATVYAGQTSPPGGFKAGTRSAAKLDGSSDSGGSDASAALEAAQQAAAAAAAERHIARPEVPLQRGLSRRLRGFEERHPQAHRQVAYWSIAASMALAGGSQIVAPGLVDAAVVQLVNTFGVLLVVFVQAVLLGHSLPLLVWPCAGVTVAGAAMVIAPSVGQGETGGLDSGRAWLGFGLSVLSMLSATSMYILLQAFRRLNLSSTVLQYQAFGMSVLVALPLTLALDGTDWAAGFAHWEGRFWAELVLGSTVMYVGQTWLLQNTTWALGAALVSMLYGLRLVASILLSKAVLSYTVIRTGVQIAGAALTVSAVTLYMAHNWWQSRRQQQAATAAAKQREPAAGSLDAAPVGIQPTAASAGCMHERSEVAKS